MAVEGKVQHNGIGRLLPTLIRGGMTVAIIAALAYIATKNNLIGQLQRIDPLTLLTAFGLLTLAYGLSTFRWQMLLQSSGIAGERFLPLWASYLVGIFFSMFLPTGAGGDAVRVYEVGKRNERIAEAFMATLQERMIGLAISLLIGLSATLYYLDHLPNELRGIAILAQVAMLLPIALLVYPQPIFRLIGYLWSTFSPKLGLARFEKHPLAAKILAAIKPIIELKPLPPAKLAQVMVVSIVAVLLALSVYPVLGQPLGIAIEPITYCLIVPLVWVIRLAPISLGGLGVSEGSFVLLISLFGVTEGPALALSLVVLGLQAGFAVIGGVIVLIRTLHKEPTV
jgi:uncharacterized protein (TIRG00374 family)